MSKFNVIEARRGYRQPLGWYAKIPYSSWLHDARKCHGDLYDYSETQNSWLGEEHHVLYRCKAHGLVRQNARDHAHGLWCPKCVPNVRRPDLFPVWVRAARKIFGNRFEYLGAASEFDTRKPSEQGYATSQSVSSFFLHCNEHGPFRTTLRKHIDSRNGACRGCEAVGWNAFATDDEKARHQRVMSFFKKIFKDINVGSIDNLPDVRENLKPKTTSVNEALYRYAIACEKRQKEEDDRFDRVYTWFYAVAEPGQKKHWWPQASRFNDYGACKENGQSALTRHRGDLFIKFDIMREGNKLWFHGKLSGEKPVIQSEDEHFNYPWDCEPGDRCYATRYGGHRRRVRDAAYEAWYAESNRRINEMLEREYQERLLRREQEELVDNKLIDASSI